MVGTLRCARPGCGGVATAWLSYDYAGQRVWLDDPGSDTAGHHSALCAIHAGRLRPPKGWSSQDRRTGHAIPSSLAPAAPRPGEPATPAKPVVCDSAPQESPDQLPAIAV